MKFTIERSDALAAISRATSVIPARGTIQILTHVLIDARSDGQVHFRATNLDIETTVIAHAAVATPGATTVSGDKLLQIVKNASAGANIEFTLSDRLAVKSGRSRFNLATLPVADFPIFSGLNASVSFEMEADKLRSVLSSAKIAASADQGRFSLTGVYLYSDGSKFGAVATDTMHLAIKENPTDIPKFGVIVPIGAVNEFAAVLEGSQTVVVNASAEKIQISLAGIEITSKVIDGEYVNFRRVIPANPPRIVEVDREALINAVRRASIASDDKARSIQVSIADNSISITSRSQGGDAADDIECGYTGDALEVGFNWSLLVKGLELFDTETVEVAFCEKMPAPITIRNGSDLVYILTPLKG